MLVALNTIGPQIFTFDFSCIAVQLVIGGRPKVAVSMHDLSLSWDIGFQGGRAMIPMHESFWMCSPCGILKLNFDRSFGREI